MVIFVDVYKVFVDEHIFITWKIGFKWAHLVPVSVLATTSNCDKDLGQKNRYHYPNCWKIEIPIVLLVDQVVLPLLASQFFWKIDLEIWLSR